MDNYRTFRDETDGAMVSSIRMLQGPVHDVVTVWNRHGLAGTLNVKAGDGIELVKRLMPDAKEVEE